MKDVRAKILMSDIFLDESIYPRENIDHKRIGIFEENLRDGFVFEPIQVQACPETETAKKGKYRILDGVHRWSAYKKTGVTEVDVVIKTLDNIEPILYAAKMAIGPKQLTEAETRNTARRAFQSNCRLTSSEIGRGIGRSRQAVDKYIADLRATALFELDLKIFKLNQLGIPQDRIAKRVGLGQQMVSRYLLQMPQVAKSVNNDFLKDFTVPHVA